MALIHYSDELWPHLRDAFLAQGQPGVIEFGSLMYKVVWADDELCFSLVPDEPEKSSFGRRDPKWRGYYPPRFEGQED